MGLRGGQVSQNPSEAGGWFSSTKREPTGGKEKTDPCQLNSQKFKEAFLRYNFLILIIVSTPEEGLAGLFLDGKKGWTHGIGYRPVDARIGFVLCQ